MANIKAKKKNIKRIAYQTRRNRDVCSRLKTLSKKLEAAQSPEEKKAIATSYISCLDKAVKKGVLHRNNANRNKSRASKLAAAA